MSAFFILTFVDCRKKRENAHYSYQKRYSTFNNVYIPHAISHLYIHFYHFHYFII